MDLAFIAKRLDAYERLIRLDKPIGTLLLLWPTLWAVWLASGGWPRLDIVLIFVVGTLLMRSAGCAINDYADRDFDAHVERTRDRPLAAGEIAPREALARGRGARRRGIRLGAVPEPARDPALVRRARDRRDLSRSPSASSPCRRPASASLSASASRWPTRRSATRCPAECWVLFAANLFLPSPTTPSTRWSIATTTRRLGIRTRRSRSAASTSRR